MLGREFVGEVVAIGEEVRDLTVRCRPIAVHQRTRSVAASAIIADVAPKPSWLAEGRNRLFAAFDALWLLLLLLQRPHRSVALMVSSWGGSRRTVLG